MMIEVTFDITVDGRKWTRTVKWKDYRGACIAAAHAERMFEICGIPAKIEVREK